MRAELNTSSPCFQQKQGCDTHFPRMLCIRSATSVHRFPSPFSLTLPSPKHHPKLSFCFKPYVKMSAAPKQTIEHIVLFKVKDDTETTKVNSMITNLNGLTSLDSVLHLSAGALHRIKSSPFPFTHMLHSRYPSKDHLSAYSAHPSHLSVVKEFVLPICDDVMAVDWVADEFHGPVTPPPGSALRLTFLKLKENLEQQVKDEVLGVIKGIKERIGGVEQITCGENFSPARAKGYSIASLAVFRGVSELDAVDSEEELLNIEKEKVRGYLESVIVIDYQLPAASQSASL